MLVNPAGIVKAGPAIGEETLLTAEFDRSERRATKAYFDAMGHYARWDAVNLEVSDGRLDPIHAHHDDVDRTTSRPVLSAAAAQSLAEEYDVDVETVEAVADAIADEG
jgi:amidase/nitrilase